MANYEFGFIGAGNMGGALAKCVCRGADPDGVILSNRTAEKARVLAEELGCHTGSVEETAKSSTYLFLGVKPQQMGGLLAGLRGMLAPRRDQVVLVSMAAGMTLKTIEDLAGGDFPVIRIMPNTPCGIGAGMILYTANAAVTAAQLDRFTQVMSAAGELCPLDEGLMDAGSAISGCGPAFVCQFIEALADGGVLCGLPRDKAQLLAAQTVLGTGRLVLESGAGPAALKDAVCSPGGSTIAGVHALEQGAFRAAAMEAVIAAWKRTKELG